MAPVARVVLLAVALACSIAVRPAQAQQPDPVDPLDALEGLVVSAIRVTGLRNLSPDLVERHLATRVGEPFHRTTLVLDQRRLDELRLFTTATIEPRQENETVVLEVTVSETLRLLPVVIIRVTDENGVSAGPGVRGINLFGGGMQFGAAVRFGGETSVAVTVDGMTVTPGTWSTHLGFSDTSRRNSLYEFDEHATTVEARIGRNWRRGLRTGVTADILRIDSGPDGPSLSSDGVDVIPTVGMFVSVDTLDTSTNPRRGTWAEVEVDRLLGDASSWTFILDGRRFQPLSARHGLGLFGLATFQTGEPGVDLPEYLRFALGGANSVRGWEVGSRRGRNQFISTVEYSYVVRPVTAFSVAGLNLYAGVQAVGFADLGLAWNDDEDFDTRSAIDGYGLGLRLLVPFVDVIRLDVAWGEPGQGALAYFGVSLKAARQRQRVR